MTLHLRTAWAWRIRASWEGWPWHELIGEGPREGDVSPARTPAGDFILWHGTSPEAAERIIAERIIRPDDLGTVGFGTTREAVASYAAMKGGAEGVRLRVVVSPEMLSMFVIHHEVGGSGRNQFLVLPRVRAYWIGVPVKEVEIA